MDSTVLHAWLQAAHPAALAGAPASSFSEVARAVVLFSRLRRCCISASRRVMPCNRGESPAGCYVKPVFTCCRRRRSRQPQVQVCVRPVKCHGKSAGQLQDRALTQQWRLLSYISV